MSETDPSLDDLTRELEALCAQRDWDAVVALRDRCRAALERGKQWWPIAAYAEYRLALEAPGPWAGAVVVEGAGRFAFGPLAEVAASTHTWAELRDHVPEGPLRAFVAHERVVRGEDLTGDSTIDADALPIPLVLQPWEPSYPLATYKPDKADFPSPEVPRLKAVHVPRNPPPAVRKFDVVLALRDLAKTWTTESNGQCDVVEVEGSALDAIAALGVQRARVAEIDGSLALAHMAWTAASGGAHGRRRGMAWGRFMALEAVADLTEAGIPDFGRATEMVHWFAWDANEPVTGWSLRLAVEDPIDGLSWGIAANDTAV